jgi:hypothetical protein
MRWLRLGLVSAGTVLLAVTLIQGQRRPTQSPDDRLGQISGYTTWARLTKEPYRASNILAALCRPLDDGERKALKADPHKEAWITVFANPQAAASVDNHDKWVFPEGSVLVKEKRSKPDDKTPELATVMIKRQAGYYPEGGDWEYAVVDAKGKTLEDGKIQRCASCHAQYAKTGYAVLTYMGHPQMVLAPVAPPGKSQ